MRTLALVLILLAGIQAVCLASGEITVSAAMSLKSPLEEIGRAFEAETNGVKAIFNFGPSGGLCSQIEAGAPVDVFVSAGQSDMDRLDKAGFSLNETTVIFASNKLVLIVSNEAKAKIDSFKSLSGDKIDKIAIGNPKTSPAGRYAMQAFEYYGVKDAVSGKLVFAEHVRQIMDYVSRREADAGIVYESDALSNDKSVNMAAHADPKSHEDIIYPATVVKGSKNMEDARRFVIFLKSKTAQGILKKYGITPKAD